MKILFLPPKNPVRLVYNVLLEDCSIKPQAVNWVSLLKKLLYESGLGYLWGNQNSLTEQKSYYCALFKDRIQDMVLQNYNADINNVSNNRLFKHIDHDFYGKDYLRTLQKIISELL